MRARVPLDFPCVCVRRRGSDERCDSWDGRLYSDLIGKFFLSFVCLFVGGHPRGCWGGWESETEGKRRDGDIADRGHYGLICVGCFCFAFGRDEIDDGRRRSLHCIPSCTNDVRKGR